MKFLVVVTPPSIYQIPLVRLSKVKLLSSLLIQILAVEFCCGFVGSVIGFPAASLDRVSGTAPPPYLGFPLYIVTPPLENVLLVFHQYLHG